MNTQIINGRAYLTCIKHNSMYPANSMCHLCYADNQRRQYRAEREQKAKELHYSASVGDFVYDTWGYEQTNVTFWQITRKTDKCLFGRKVETRLEDHGLPNGKMAMSGKAYPVKNDFKETETRINLNKVDLYDGVNGVSASWYG